MARSRSSSSGAGAIAILLALIVALFIFEVRLLRWGWRGLREWSTLPRAKAVALVSAGALGVLLPIFFVVGVATSGGNGSSAAVTAASQPQNDSSDFTPAAPVQTIAPLVAAPTHAAEPVAAYT